MRHEITIQNTGSTRQTVDLFTLDRSGQGTKRNRFTLPYAATYSSGTDFRTLIGSINYEFTVDAEITLAQLIALLTEKTFAKWSVVSSDAIGGNVIDCISVDGASELEINSTALPAPVFVSATTTIDGSQIEITFDKSMADPTGKHGQFAYTINTVPDSFTAAALKVGDDAVIVLDCNTAILELQSIEVSYTVGDVQSADGGILGSFAGESVTNITNMFNIGTGFDGYVYSIAIQSDGKVLLGGEFNSYNGTTSRSIFRLNTDGSIDATFNTGTAFNEFVESLAIQSDGKVLLGGDFTSYDGTASNFIIRLNADGSIDATFNIGTGFDSTVHVLAIQSDGKVLLGGNFTFYDGTASNSIIRLNTDGSIDATFNIGTGFDNEVTSLAIQSDGKVLIGGGFTSYNGTASNSIIRLNTDGSIDATFNIGTGFNDYLESISIQTDGKILVGGSFASYDGNAKNRIIRLNSDGSIDATFNTGTGFDNEVTSLAIQSDGKVLIGGGFTSYNGTAINSIIRLNTDGSIDATFNTGTGFDNINYVDSLAIQSDGKVLVGGEFTSYNGNTRNYIIRLNSDGSDNTTTI